MSSDSIITLSRDKSSAFSPFLVDSSEKIPFSSGICSLTFGCPQPYHTSYSCLTYPSLVGPAHAQRYLRQREYGFMPSIDDKGVVQNMVPFLHSAPIPGMFGYHPIEEEKPSQSYIGLIGKAILSTPQKKLVLSDIYNYILNNYPYFRNKGPGWRNSIRHNLSLNECFIKVGRSPNGKGHFWAINPTNYEDFSKGEYRRKRTNKKRTSGENLKLKNTEKEISIVPKPDEKLEYFKTGIPSAGTLSSGHYGKYPVNCSPKETTTAKEHKGFHIETLLSGLVKNQNQINLKQKDNVNIGLKTQTNLTEKASFFS